MKHWTISEIKTLIKSGCDNHFFDRDTLKFFGQTMRSFKVRHVNGRVFIYAHGKHGIITFREFMPQTKLLKSISVNTMADVENVIDGVREKNHDKSAD